MAAPGPHDSIRQLLHRRDLAAARHRVAISRHLGLGESEMTAVAHLAQRGQLTPTELGALLDLSSGGVSALVARLEDAGQVVREPHPSDGRSHVVRLAPELVRRAGQAFDPLVADLDRICAELGEPERELVRRFLARAVEVSELHAERAHRALRARPAAPAERVPALWG